MALERQQREEGVLPGWLLGAIVKFVALYTTPGQRVLLLARPADPDTGGEAGRMPVASPAGESGSGLLTGLVDAAQTAARLGRTVHARSGQPRLGADRLSGAASSGGRSGVRLLHESADPVPTRSGPRGDRGPTAAGPDHFHAVVALVDPRAADWVTRTDWADLLAPEGILAFITHSDHREGQLLDPGPLLARSARQAGLTFLDRIVLLEAPIRRGALRAPTRVEEPPVHRGVNGPGPRHTRVHSDLVLFARRTSADDAGEGEAR